MSISSNYLAFAAEEGSQSALDGLQTIQDALESILEVGSQEERSAAAVLLSRVNEAIGEILHVANPANQEWD